MRNTAIILLGIAVTLWICVLVTNTPPATRVPALTLYQDSEQPRFTLCVSTLDSGRVTEYSGRIFTDFYFRSE